MSRMNKAPTAVTVRASIVSKSLREKTNMNSISTAVSTINVPFHGAELYVINHNGEPYTPMKPIVEGMGMAWQSQLVKIKQRFNTCVTEIVMLLPGDNQRRSVVCIALRKLAGWLQTISPNKVKPEIRDRVIQYQEECDDVLYEYWTKGQVTNPRKTSTDERTPLRDAINMLVGKRGIMYPEAYSYVHQRFNVSHIDELPAEQLPVVIEYIHRLALEGEFLGKQESLPAPVSSQFTDEELCTLANLWRSAAVMYEACKEVYPLLLAADHRLVPRFCSIGANYNRGINRARVLLKRETGHIKEHPWGDSNWKNTLTYDMKDF